MAELTSFGILTAGKKRSRGDDDDGGLGDAFDYSPRYEKRARPDSADSNTRPNDSVLNTPTTTAASKASIPKYQDPRYDSDEHSSMLSEPGSPQDIAMSSNDEDEDEDMFDSNDIATFSQSPETHYSSPRPRSSPWQIRGSAQTQRVATPILPPPTRSHVRKRHPQEIFSSSPTSGPQTHLDVPSPIDEDEVPTPPSAAEAAGSQLSMLSVNDMDTSADQPRLVTDFVPADEEMMMEGGGGALTVKRQRQRSGALSSPATPVHSAVSEGKRGLSMGWRADCEKCRLRVPGHMNHFVG